MSLQSPALQAHAWSTLQSAVPAYFATGDAMSPVVLLASCALSPSVKLPRVISFTPATPCPMCGHGHGPHMHPYKLAFLHTAAPHSLSAPSFSGSCDRTTGTRRPLLPLRELLFVRATTRNAANLQPLNAPIAAMQPPAVGCCCGARKVEQAVVPHRILAFFDLQPRRFAAE